MGGRTSRSMETTVASIDTNLTGQAIGGISTFDSKLQLELFNAEDAIWILSCTFVIFTMQSGRLKTLSSTDLAHRESGSLMFRYDRNNVLVYKMISTTLNNTFVQTSYHVVVDTREVRFFAKWSFTHARTYARTHVLKPMKSAC